MACSCSGTDIFNSGVPGCVSLPSVIKRIVLVPTTDASGAYNRIDLSSIPTNTAIIALINQDDAQKRYYPVAKSMVNVTNVRSEVLTEDFDDGTVVKIRNGVKTFHGEFIKQSAALAGELAKVECASMSAFLVDGDGSLIGDKSTPGYLTPIPIKDGTWNVQTLDTTDTTIAKVTLDFQWADSVADGDIGFLVDSDFEDAVNWLNYVGLVGITGGAASSITVNGFTMEITNDYGSLSGQPVTGLALTDFDCNELTPTPATAPLTSVTESTTSLGTYTFVWTTAQVSADTVEVSIKSTTFGYDDTNLKTSIITVP